jgi:GR25 family glycosyltransferase involved in LPS biosynthesis
MNILIIHNSVKRKTKEIRDISKLSSLSDNVKIIEAIFPDDLTEEQIDYYITKKNFVCMPAGYKNPEKIKSKICCSLSHFKALEFIIENKLNDVIIFEDDAVMYNENLFEKFLSNRDLFEKNYITYLGGGFFINSKNETTKYIMDTHAYYIHNYEQATKLYDKLKNAKKLKAIDSLIKRQIQEKNLPYDWFPIFIQNDEYISNIEGKKKIKSWIKLEKSLTSSRELNQGYIIAIPSHQRLEQLEKKTLSLLTRHKIDMKKVYVFSSSSSIEEYKNLADKYGFTLVDSKDTILDTRNHIIEYFAENTKIIEMDDDIEDIQNTIKGVKNTPVVDLNQIFNNSFEKLNGQGLWGFNANTNNYFACGIDKFGLYSIINSCLGYYNDKRIKLTVSEKEDFERCIQFYKLEIPILKQTQFGIKTRYWKNKGGIQAKYGFEQRVQVQRQSADDIMKKYPVFCYKQTRSNGIVDIRFKKFA